MYMPATTALQQMQQLQLGDPRAIQDKHESTTDTKPGHRRQRSLSENDANKETSITVQIQQLPNLSQAPMQKLLVTALQLHNLLEILTTTHLNNLQDLESTSANNSEIHKITEEQLSRARGRVNKSTETLKTAI
jgi:hypothetical protein